MKKMKLIVMATTALGSFFRCGREWTKEGIVIGEDDFSQEQFDVLSREPNLHIREATADEIAAAKATVAPLGEDDVIDELVRAIPTLTDGAFGKTGVPDLKSLREATSLTGKLVTVEARDAALAKLVESGFQVPVQTGA